MSSPAASTLQPSLPEGFAKRPARSAFVLGAGTWGVALADALARNDIRTLLWDHKPERLAQMLAQGRHYKLSAYQFHPNIEAAGPLNAETVPADAWLVLAVPSFAMRETLDELRAAGVGQRQEKLVLSAKGLELATRMTMVELTQDVLGSESRARVAALSGPSLAPEVVSHIPTTVVAAADDLELARATQAMFISNSFRVYALTDLRGVELGGAFKNVYAIAAGVIAGLGFGDNTLAALMTRGLAEMSRLGVAMGGSPSTFAGLAGLGDLIVTCCSRHSRNRRFGELRAGGRTTEQAQEEIGQAIEGIRTALSVHEIATELSIDMPIVAAVHALIYGGKDPREAVRELMSRDAKEEDTLPPAANLS
jgi:glycerol-3-phosphate dehydrogenase (NAD(P)+)